MEIRIRDTGAVMLEGEFRTLFSTKSLPVPLTEEIIHELGADIVLEGPQATPTRYQTSFRNGVELKDNQWFTRWGVTDMDDEAKAAIDAQQAKSVREQRNAKLAETDWTQLVDSTVEQAIWAVYRQELRDVPNQAGFPWDTVWPTKP